MMYLRHLQAVNEVNPLLFTIATLTGHVIRAYGPNYSVSMCSRICHEIQACVWCIVMIHLIPAQMKSFQSYCIFYCAICSDAILHNVCVLCWF